MKKITLITLIVLFILSSLFQGQNFTAISQPNKISSESSQKLSATPTYPTTNVYATHTSPNVTDGVKDAVWSAVGAQHLVFTNSSNYNLSVDFYILHDNNYLYVAYQYFDATPYNSSNQQGIDEVQLILDINQSSTWNQGGGDVFDVLYGTFFIGTLTPVTFDYFENSTGTYQDTSSGGQANTIGAGSYNNATHTYFYELAQPLNGPDPGHDIHLHVNDSILYLASVRVNSNVYVSNIGKLNIEQQTFTSPKITIISPSNYSTVNSSTVPVSFSVNESTPWIGYSIDGQSNVTVNGNFSLSSLTSGIHTLVIYVNDSYGAMSKSDLL